MKKALLLIFISLSLTLFSQSFCIQGSALDVNFYKDPKALKGITINLLGSDGYMAKAQTDSNGHYIFDSTDIKPNTTYSVIAPNAYMRYTHVSSTKLSASTVGIKTSRNLVLNFNYTSAIVDIWATPMLFSFNSSQLSQQNADSTLFYLVTLMEENPGLVINFDGHASSDEGTATQKQKLSEDRAQVCKTYLVAHGIDTARIKTKGWGDTRPIPGFSTDDMKKMTLEQKRTACERNRRVEYRGLRFNYPYNSYSFNINGTVRDKQTGKPLYKASVRLLGSDGLIRWMKTDTGGHYIFDSTILKPNTTYTIEAEDPLKQNRKLHIIQSVIVSTPAAGSNKTFLEDFALFPMLKEF